MRRFTQLPSADDVERYASSDENRGAAHDFGIAVNRKLVNAHTAKGSGSHLHGTSKQIRCLNYHFRSGGLFDRRMNIWHLLQPR